MKKITILLIFCFLFFTISLFAQDDKIAWNDGDPKDVIVTPNEDVIWMYGISKKKEAVGEKGPFRVPDRKFEMGLFNVSLGFSNNFMTASEFFRKKVEINIDKLSDGFNITANFALIPIFLSYNKDDIWGFGLTTGLELTGNIGLNGNMLTFKGADAVESDIGATVFAETKIHGFFTIKKIKLKFAPAMYYPIVYAKPENFSYTFKNNNGINETIFHIALDMQVYSAFPIDDGFNIINIIKNNSAKPGYDISIGAEYPLSETLELMDKYDFLDFDVGVDFINIPLYPSRMEDYRQMIVNIGSEKPIDFFNGMFGESSEENESDSFFSYKFDDNYSKGRRTVIRPFKMLISANWRPLDNPFLEDSNISFKLMREWLTVTPILGFAINPLYFQPISFEGGIRTRLSFANLFFATLGIGYFDRLWKNSLDIAFNFRIYEIDLGVGMQSSSFLKSWSGGGFGGSLAFKFGW